MHDKGKPELLLWILCVPLVVCLSEIIVSESNSNLIQHPCIMLSYLYMIFFNLLLKFINMFNNSTQPVWHLWVLQPPPLSDPRDDQFTSIYLRVLTG